MKPIFLVSLILLLCLLSSRTIRAADPYSLSVSSLSVTVGEPVTVGWKGNCSHGTWTGCYDWVAAFQRGACSDPSAPAQDTCYLRNEWTWVSKQTTNSWTFAFDGPGDYEFRIPYCGCQECQPLLADMAECPSYPTEGVSPSIRVLPPFDLSPFSPAEQFVLGIAWVLMEGKPSAIQQLLAKPPKFGSCNTCFCDVKNLALQAEKSSADFHALLEAPSSSLFEQMTSTMSDLGDLVRTVSDALNDCGINQIVGKDVLSDLLAGAAAWVTGLEEVATVFKMAVSGEKVYADLSNAVISWELSNYFASGVNTGRMAMAVLSTYQLKSLTATGSSVLTAPCMLRHPGGSWSACDCASPLDLSRFPGNKCRRLNEAQETSPSPSSSSLSAGETAAVVIGCVGLTALISAVVVVIRRRKRAVGSRQTPLLGFSVENDERL